VKIGDAMAELSEVFIKEVEDKFKFLEKYGYKEVKIPVENQEDYRDAKVIVKYIGKSVGIEISWYFAGAHIGLAFIELRNGEFPEDRVFFSEPKGRPLAIDLYTLARFMDELDDSDFLLKNIDNLNTSAIKKRLKVITENMSGVVEGLAQATEKLASDILKGDTSVFGDVVKLKTKIIAEQYPHSIYNR
jgi:hypothetical protein